MSMKRKCIIAACVVVISVLAIPVQAQFDIEFNFVNGTAADQAAFEPLLDETKQFWEDVITGYQDGVSLTGADIDVDLTLLAGNSGAFGGHGLLGDVTVQGGFTFRADSQGIRNRGFVAMNPFRINDPNMQNALTHEVGHVLGLGRLWVENGVYVNDSGEYTGPRGLDAYRKEFDSDATFVPIALGNFGGNAHLAENDAVVDAYGRTISSDVNTGFLDLDPNATFLSRTTESMLADIGFRIRPECDFNGDEVCSIQDIDLLVGLGPIDVGVQATLGETERFDLTGDATIDLQDLSEWLALAATENGLASPYLPGDSNLDGVVDVSDFNRWNANRFTSSLLWSNGNFSGDDTIDVQDFNIWNGNKFTSSDLNSVPEPSTIAMLFCLGLGLLMTRCFRRS